MLSQNLFYYGDLPGLNASCDVQTITTSITKPFLWFFSKKKKMNIRSL